MYSSPTFTGMLKWRKVFFARRGTIVIRSIVTVMAPERSRGTGATTSRLPPLDGLRLESFCFFLVGVRSVMWLVVSGGLIGRSLLDPGGRELATQLSLEGEWLQVRMMTADCLSVVCHYSTGLSSVLRETGEKCIFLPNMQALVAIYILGKLLSYGPRPQIFFNQGIGRDICVATKWGRIHGYARAPK